MSKSPNNPAKKKAWDAFSRYKRLYDCLKSTGSPLVGICITCDRQFQYSYLQAGHYLSGKSNAVLFSMKFVNAQCPYCNEFQHGKPKEYRIALVKRHGEAFVDKWENKLRGMAKRGAISDRDMNFEARAERYTRQWKDLLHGYGCQTLGESLKYPDLSP